jgi:hypothetical protein
MPRSTRSVTILGVRRRYIGGMLAALVVFAAGFWMAGRWCGDSCPDELPPNTACALVLKCHYVGWRVGLGLTIAFLGFILAVFAFYRGRRATRDHATNFGPKTSTPPGT